MRKSGKKLLSLLLALVMVLGLAPVGAFAADSDFTIENGVLKKYNGSGGAVAIPDGVTSIGRSAFENCTDLTNVTIPNSVIRIGEFAFRYCSGLTRITIPDSVTSIGSSTFDGCTGLTDVTISNSVASIGQWTFRGCMGLTSVTIPNSITSIGDEAFRGCASLTNMTIPNSVTNIGNFAFRDCTGLTDVTIPNSVTRIGNGAFGSCTGLSGVVIPDSVTYIGDFTFAGCTGLSSVTIPDSVTKIGDLAFYGCAGLTSVTIPSSVTSIGDSAFCGCMGLTRVTILNNIHDTPVGNTGMYGFVNVDSSGHGTLGVNEVPRANLKIGTNAFEDCTNLTDVYFAGTEEQWKTIYISSGNECLTYATIHYNSTVPDKIDPIRFDQGNSYTVNVGGSISFPCSVPNPKRLITSDVTFTSSDPSVASVAVANDLDLSAMELLSFTLNVIGLKAGTTTITAKASDGRSASCQVTVRPKPQVTESEFDADVYHANWLITKSTAIKELERNTPSKLRQDPATEITDKCWQAFSTILSTPSDLYGTAKYILGFSNVDMYEALLLDALHSVAESKPALDTLNSSTGYANDLLDYISKIVKSSHKLDIMNSKDYKTITEQVDLEKDIKKWFTEKHATLSDLSIGAEFFSKSMKTFSSADEWRGYVDSCLKLAALDQWTRDILDQAYQICRNDTEEHGVLDPLTIAISECIAKYDAGSNGYWESVKNGGLRIASEEGMRFSVNKLWSYVLKGVKSDPQVQLYLMAISAGQTLTKIYCNTDDVAEKYLAMEYITDIEEVFDRVYADTKSAFSASPNVKNANLLLAAMRLSFQLRDTDCKTAANFQDSLNSGAFFILLDWCGIDNWSSSATETKESLAAFQDSYRVSLQDAETGWIHYLEEDYPGSGLYEMYEPLIEKSINSLTKEVIVQCPVNIYVYDQSGTAVAYAVDGKISCLADDLIIAVEGEEKTVCFLDDADYRIECVGYDNGNMDVTLIEYDANESPSRTVNYYDVPLTKQKTFTIHSNDKALSLVEQTNHSTVERDYDSSNSGTLHIVKTVDCTLGQNGKTFVETKAQQGETLQLHAFVPDGKEFDAWYAVNGNVVFSDAHSQNTSFIMPDGDVTVQAVLKDQEVTPATISFTDVPSNSWYYDAVYWAVGNNITNGTGVNPATFSPAWECKQVEILTFLWRAAGEPVSSAQLPFTPKNSWADGALRWGIEMGMINASFNENAPCTRATAVKFMWQAAGSPSASGGGFSDVPANADYAQAVAWAVNNGITNGTGTNPPTFSPNKTCNRAEIVTLLYRAR